jgi:phosphate ABC transporter phosphate-binding protein
VLIGMICVFMSCAQSQASPSQTRKLYVDQFSEGDEAAPLRQSLIKHLQKSGRYQVVDSAEQADLIVHGSGEVWIKGYLAINLRAPSANRQAVYGGYLSVDVVTKSEQPIWSYLVTPSKLSWTGVRDDLANNLVKEMLSASSTIGALSDTADTTSAAAVKLTRTSITGSGATFPAPLYKKWFASFQKLHPEVQITYKEVGSEAGAAALADGQVDFAASDLPPSDADDAPAGQNFRRIASVLGAVVPVYNIKGVNHDLKFTPGVLAGIYLGRIRKWNDNEIRSLNKDADLPDAEIVVVHRSDGSGTTHAWSEFLSKTVPEWKDALGTGTRLKWPVGIGVEGNEKMATTVLETPNSIGYVELVYAIQHRLSFGAVRNRSGEFIHAHLDSLADAARSEQTTQDDGQTRSILDPADKNAYPIATFTWLLLPAKIDDAGKKTALIALLQWILTSGQRECSSLGYAPLPREVADHQLQIVNAYQ